jgi:hypothetical protein
MRVVLGIIEVHIMRELVAIRLSRVDVLPSLGIGKGQLVGSDSHYGAVPSVDIGYMVWKIALHQVVGLVEDGGATEQWPRILSEGMEEKVVA